MDTEKILAVTLMGILLFPVAVAAAAWTGFAASVLWMWFAVPLGAPPVTVLEAAGISVIARMVLMRPWLADLAGEARLIFEEAATVDAALDYVKASAAIAATWPTVAFGVGLILRAFQ